MILTGRPPLQEATAPTQPTATVPVTPPQHKEKSSAAQFTFEPKMILIPAGEFLIGSDPQQDGYAQDNEQPQHRLYLSDYYLAKTPVTNAQYRAFLQATGSNRPEYWTEGKLPSGKEDHPVEVFSNDALAYCHWLSEVTGRSYSLPSEAEWEKGARGTDGRIYPWGNEWDKTRCNAENGHKGTTPVQAHLKGASSYGVLDTVGNIWEWTRSLWGRYPYPTDKAELVQREGLQVAKNNPRVLRGGACDSSRHKVRCAYRRHQGGWLTRNGFRAVVDP